MKKNMIICDDCKEEINGIYYEKDDKQLCGHCFVSHAIKKLKWQELME